jgi:hypothetical protein
MFQLKFDVNWRLDWRNDWWSLLPAEIIAKNRSEIAVLLRNVVYLLSISSLVNKTLNFV